MEIKSNLFLKFKTNKPSNSRPPRAAPPQSNVQRAIHFYFKQCYYCSQHSTEGNALVFKYTYIIFNVIRSKIF